MNKKSEKNSVFHNILTVVGIIMCIILIPMLLMNVTLLVKSFVSEDVPSFGGVIPEIVLTESMTPEINGGDLIFVRQCNAEDVKTGDVISFFDPSGNGTAIVTHRVVEIIENEDGTRSWRTKGDANNVEDSVLVNDDKLVGKWYGTHLAGLGNVAMFMQTTTGLLVCVVAPLVLLVGYDIIRRKIYEKSTKQDTEALMAELEALRAAKAAAENAGGKQE